MKEFDRIIGYSAEKKELEQIADCLRNSDIYKELGVNAPCGLLLYGEPGVGKTLMSECLIKASGRKSFVCRKNKPNGEFVNEITKTFEQAEKNAPSIVFLDDMDKFANEDEGHRNAEEYVTVQSCIDSVKDKDVFVLATANNIRTLPDSLIRTGRFDRRLEIENPEGSDAVEIISHYLADKPISEDVDKEYIARLLIGSSCAKVETLLNEAGIYAGFDRKSKITMEHFLRAYLRDKYGSSSSDDCYDCCDADVKTDDGITEPIWHEAGHVVVSEVLNPGSVTLVSVLHAGGKNGRGFTSYDNINNMRHLDYTAVRAVGALAGAAAVEQMFGVTGDGTLNDFNYALNMIREMIEDYGISGYHLIEHPYRRNSDFMNSDIEKATIAKFDEYYRKAKEIIAKNHELLEKIASALAEKKLLTASEIQAIKNECRIVALRM